MKSFGILVSGRGSNMAALIEASAAGQLAAKPVVVFSNNPEAAALTLASGAGLTTIALDHRQFADRQSFDEAVIGALSPFELDFVVLAGYMRIVTPTFLEAWPQRVLNIHPALLPAFPGVRGVEQAWQYGARVIGCTVHLVDAQVDHGPILVQKAIAVDPEHSAEQWAEQLISVEHAALIEAVNMFASHSLQLDGRRATMGPSTPADSE